MNSKLYSKCGDAGFSAVLDKQKSPKSAPVFEALGDLDELNSWLGLVKWKMENGKWKIEIKDLIAEIQKNIMWLSSEIAGYVIRDTKYAIRIDWPAETKKLEDFIDKHSKKIKPGFVIPGESEISSLLHLARAVCRRAERRLVKLKSAKGQHLAYINRLSDFLYLLALITEK